MITDMDKWTRIRRHVLVGGMSRREASDKYNLSFRTIQKILDHEGPPGYRKKGHRGKPANSLSLVRFDRNDYSVPTQSPAATPEVPTTPLKFSSLIPSP